MTIVRDNDQPRVGRRCYWHAECFEDEDDAQNRPEEHAENYFRAGDVP